MKINECENKKAYLNGTKISIGTLLFYPPLKLIIMIYRGSYMSAHVLLNLLNELRNRDKMRGLLSILSLFRNEFI